MLGLVLLAGGLVLVVVGAEIFFGGLLSTAARLGVAAFVLTVVVSGLELENLAAGIAANVKGLGNAAAGTSLGGTTFLALGVAGLGAVIAPIRARLPAGVLLSAAVAPLPLLALGLDGDLSRLDGGVLVVWSAVAIAALAYAGRGLLGEEPERKRHPLFRLFAGLALLSGAGIAVAEGLRRVVTSFGVSPTLLGNTAVAASVEVEEVGRVAVPSRHGRGEVALGSIFGTVAHFAAFNIGIIALVRPLTFDHATRVLHLPAAAGSVVLLAVVVGWRSGLGRPAGTLLLCLYVAYVAAAIFLSA